MKPPPNNRKSTESEAIELPDELPRLPEIELPDDSDPLPEVRETEKVLDAVVDSSPCPLPSAEQQMTGDHPFEPVPTEAFTAPSLTRTIENGSRHEQPPPPSSDDLLKALSEVGFEVSRLQPSGKQAGPPA